MKSGQFSVVRRNVSHGFRHYKEKQRYLYESIVRIPLGVGEKRSCHDQTTRFFEPLPLMTSDSILSFLVALVVTSTPPSTAERESAVCANGSTLRETISSVVGSEEDPVTTCRFAEIIQLELIAWSGSAEATSIVMSWGFPSVRSGTKGVRST